MFLMIKLRPENFIDSTLFKYFVQIKLLKTWIKSCFLEKFILLIDEIVNDPRKDINLQWVWKNIKLRFKLWCYYPNLIE